MPAFSHHIFVCCNRREPGHRRGCCNPDGSEALRTAFKAGIERLKLAPRVRANFSGCLDQCELGPTVVIYPQGIWYGRVQLQDVDRILEKTILQGEILDDLLIPNELLNTKGGTISSPRGE